MGQLDGLHDLFGRNDFKEVWMTVGTHIKIKQINNLDDLPGYNKSSHERKQELKEFYKLDCNYETFTDQGCCYNTDLILLNVKKKRNWIGVFEYKYTRTCTKVLALLLGNGVMIGGTYYFLPIACERVTSLLNYILQNLEKIQNILIKIFNGFFTLATVTMLREFQQWLFNDLSGFNTLVAACMLKKLYDVSGFRMDST
jgi:hypothetical protein